MNLIKKGTVIPQEISFLRLHLQQGFLFHVRNDADGACVSPKANVCNTLFFSFFYQEQRLLTMMPRPERCSCFEALQNKNIKLF